MLGPWQLVDRVASNEFLAIYRARPADRPNLPDADYLIKAPAAGPQDRSLAAALLAREKAILRSAFSPFLPALLGSDLRHDPPYLVLANLGTQAMANASRKLSMRRALWMARQVAAALAVLHAAGWIHTRVTPSALFLSRRGHLALHDLGWARRIGSDECRGDALLAADLRYVAPEMLSDATMLTPACDIYCLGLLLIELLAGRPAVDAIAGWQAALCHLRGQIADVSRLRPDAPQPLIQLLRSMTCREPLRRPSAAEVRQLLVRLEIGLLSENGERGMSRRPRPASTESRRLAGK